MRTARNAGVGQGSGLSTLARQAKRGYERTKRGRAEFIDGTLELAEAMSRARAELRADQAFHEWMQKIGLSSISKDDRAALIRIGKNTRTAKAYFQQNSESWSWRSCVSTFPVNLSVSQTAKPAPTPGIVTDEKPRHVAAPHLQTSEPPEPMMEPEPPEPTHIMLVASSDEPAKQPPPTITEFPEPPGLAAAIEAVQGVVKASSSLWPSVVVFHRGDELPSLTQLRAASQYLLRLADAKERRQEQVLSAAGLDEDTP
jgi:hypothetical protein